MADPPARFEDLCLDAVDHQALADGWCAATGHVRREPAGGQPRDRAWPVLSVDPSGAGPASWVDPVPEPKTVESRVQHDVVGDTAALVALGATLLRARDDVPTSDHDA